MISVKKMPIDKTMAEFWKVALMPAPTPRRSGGRLFMIPARFGEANRPMPMPLNNRIAANSAVGHHAMIARPRRQSPGGHSDASGGPYRGRETSANVSGQLLR
jgi:hypothetical protein